MFIIKINIVWIRSLSMEVLSAIIQMLGGLAMFLYGIELMGDGLKNSSGEALKRVLEKITGKLTLFALNKHNQNNTGKKGDGS